MEKTITCLEAQKNHPDRINVYLDGEFAFGLSRYIGAWLYTGQKIDERKIKALTIDDEKERALQSALRFIGYKQRTEAEVINKLEDLNYSSIVIDAIMQELKEKKYVDDKEFAVQWIETRGESHPRGKNLFLFELRKKGIPADVIEEAMKNFPDEAIMALKLGKKYLNRFLSLSDDDFRKKMTGILLRRAFPYPVINESISTLIKIRNNESIEEQE
jgi:regulatory protein